METTRYLKQTGSGHIYVRTEALAARKDMTECDSKGGYLTPDQIAKAETPAQAATPAPPVAEGAAQAEPHIVPASGCLPPLDQMDVNQLRAVADERKIRIPETMKKTETIRAFLIEKIDDEHRT